MDRSYRTTGWIAFAGIVLAVVAMWNMTLGLALIFKDDWAVFTEDGLVFLNTAGWGWILLLTGLLKLFTGFGLLSGREWARLVAIALVFVNMFEQIVLINATPWWSLASIVISVFVLYALIVPEEEYV
jgi:hypothetical protein